MSVYLSHGRKAFRTRAFDGFGDASRSFDGVDDQITIADNNDLPLGSQTWACWVKFNTLNNSANDLMLHWKGSSNQASLALVVSVNKPRFFYAVSGVNSGFVEAATAVTTGQWYHLASVFQSNGDLIIYVNGSEDGRLVGVSASVHDSTAPLTLGNRTDQSFVLDGNLCDCRIYDTDIGATNIAALANGTDIQTNLVGHWLKDTDDVIDHSVNLNDGDNAFEPEYSTDSPNKNYATSGQASRSFNGLNDYIDLGDNDIFSFNNNPATNTDKPFSVSAWIKMNNAAKFRILSKWDNNGVNETEWTLTTDSLNQLNLILDDRSTVARRVRQYTGTLMTTYVGQWIHVVGTYDGRGGSTADQGINLYVNNVQVDDNSGNTGSYVAMENTVTPVEIGSLTTSVERGYADGLIADVRLYSDELTAGEVTNLYNGTDHTDNLIGHWLGNSNDLLDMSVNNNNGTHEGAQYSTDGPKP